MGRSVRLSDSIDGWGMSGLKSLLSYDVVEGYHADLHEMDRVRGF